MPPVHADIVQSAIDRTRGSCGQRIAQECRKDSRGHFARRHRKIAVLGPPAAHCLWDRYIVGRIGERHGGLLAVHQAGIIRRPRVVAKKTMPIAASPEVALSTYG